MTVQCPKCKKMIPDDAALCCYCGKVILRKQRRTRRRPSGTGSIRKLNDVRRSKPYRVEKGGKRLGDFPSMEAAQQFLDKINAKPRLSDTINMTLEDCHDLWKERDYPQLTAKGKETYDAIWPKFAPLKGMKMREITTETVQPLVDAEISKGRSRSQQEKIRSMYSLLCQIVPIVATIRPFVRYFYERADGNLFLSGYMGNQSAGNFRRRDYYPTLERLGIRTPERTMRPHSCRYTLATRGHSLGIDNDTLVKILGHADFDTTSAYYIQADLDKLHSEMSKIDDLSAKRPRSDQTRKTGKREKP